ncbi:MAG: pimeloyl-ACP methyl ester carboxylesterase [Halioglobus sp.]|jgi:pimeloyl-ACP methyl ester carboxylesterase
MFEITKMKGHIIDFSCFLTVPVSSVLHGLKPLLCIVGVVVMSGCTGLAGPSLERLYSMQAGNPNQPPVVFIHGTLGSRLVHSETGEEAWPGSLRNIIFSDYRSIRLDIDVDTLNPASSEFETAGIAERAAGRDFYGRILATLRGPGGYTQGKLGVAASRGDKQFYVFSYDWRQDNVQSARKLDQFLREIREDYDDPDLKVDIVAHSMGGLITRYYARYGSTDVLDGNDFDVTLAGERTIRRVILLGTPNLGSVGAMRILIKGYPVGLGVIPPEVVATFPSTYQLLPHSITDWFVTLEGKPIKRDQFSADEYWRRFGFSVFNDEIRKDIRGEFTSVDEADRYLAVLERYFEKHVERARRFSWSLTVPNPQSELKFILFGGDCLPTPARAVVEDVNGESVLRLKPSEIVNPVAGIDYELLMSEPGDGTVTKASLLARSTFDPSVERHKYSNFSVDYPVFLCEKHDQLTGNLDFQNNLLHALLSVDR